MFCYHCGSVINDNASFCSRCGKPVFKSQSEEIQIQNNDNIVSHIAPKEDRNKKKHKKKKIIALIAIILIIAIISTVICFVVSLNKKPKADNNEVSYEIAESNDKWDEILCAGDGYYIVRKTIDTYNNYAVMVGVVDSNEKWIYEPSTDNIFAKAIKESSGKKEFVNGTAISMKKSNFAYLGNGVFIASLGVNYYTINGYTKKYIGSYSASYGGLPLYFFNVEKNAQTCFEAISISDFYNGYMLMYGYGGYNNNYYYSVDLYGNVKELPCEHSSNIGSFPFYSEGLFFSNNMFYDIQGNVVLNLTRYNIYAGVDSQTAPYFRDGVCYFKFLNDGGTYYECEINKSGSFVKEPQVCRK